MAIELIEGWLDMGNAGEEFKRTEIGKLVIANGGEGPSPKRAAKVLYGLGIKTIEQCQKMEAWTFLEAPWGGRKTLRAIDQALTVNGTPRLEYEVRRKRDEREEHARRRVMAAFGGDIKDVRDLNVIALAVAKVLQKESERGERDGNVTL